ncbi:MAG: Asp-tRNA(Asn)/Glu-tRNA(Gln) amidotransferase subunit GatC [Chlorobi bacterium]|nr:Asp-tRNA(Asn)/Glu-tRNA(Gln) amidotransferase subunit GatC [Chlorobiota bacterium]
MAVTQADIDRAATLAALSFSEEEARRLVEEFKRVLSWIDKLREVDTEGVEPLTYVHQKGIMFREDETRPCPPRDDALRNAPQHTGEFFVAPRVRRS